VSIYHNENENGLLEADEALVTARDTTTISGSTIFTASASFTSGFGVGGKSGSTGAASTGNGSGGNCDSSAFGRGKSIQVYEISYELCEDEQLSVIAESYCGPAQLSVLHAGGMTRGGLSMNQPYLDEHRVLLTAPISQYYDKFRVLVENDKSYYDKLIIPKKLHGLVLECQKTITISSDTGYLSNQTNSFDNLPGTLSNQTNSFDNQPEKTTTPRKTISIDEFSINDAFFEPENDNVQTTTLVYDPEPCVDTWDDSCVVVDPEPCVDTWDDSCVVVDPEPCVDTWDDSCKDSRHDYTGYLLSWLFDIFSN